MATGNQLPEGFVLDSQVTPPPAAGVQAVPEGFMLDAPVDKARPIEQDPQPDAISQDVTQELPVGNVFDAITEPLTSIAANVVGESGERLQAAGNFLSGDNPVKASQDAAGFADTMRDFGAPTTQAGEYSLRRVGDFIDAGVDVANMSMGGLSALSSMAMGGSAEDADKLLSRIKDEGYMNVISDEVLKKTNSPWLASVAKQMPEIVGAIFPISKIIEHRGAQIIPNQEIARRIIEGDTSGELAKYIVDGAGKLKFDPVAQQAIDAGLDQGLMMAVKGLPAPEGIGVLAKKPPLNPTKEKMLEMIEVKKKGQQDRFYADQNRPADVAGKSLAKRIKHVIKVNKDAGKAIDNAANNLKGKPVDFSAPINSFVQSLDTMGIKLDPKTFKPKFEGSDVEGFKGDEQAITRVISRLSSGKKGVVPDAYDLHRLKRYLDNNLSYGKANASGGMSGQTEQMLKKLRREIDAAIDGQFPDYDTANTVYADTIETINEIQRLTGRNTDISGSNIDRSLGILTRRMLGNNQSTVNVIDSVNDITNVARKYGGQFDDNLPMLVSFSSQLDNIFGASASNGFQGGIEAALSSTLKEMQGGKSMKRKAAEFVTNKLSPNEKDAFDIIKKAIEGGKDEWRN